MATSFTNTIGAIFRHRGKALRTILFCLSITLSIVLSIACNGTDTKSDGDFDAIDGDLEGNSGSQCLEDEDCPSSDYKCFDGYCRLSCQTDQDCPAEIPICNQEGFCEAFDDGKESSDGDTEADFDIEDESDTYEEDIDNDSNELEADKENAELDLDSSGEVEADKETDEPETDKENVEEVDEDSASENESDECEIDLEEIQEDEVDAEEIPCVCSEGPCCDGCQYLDGGILCLEEVQTERICGPLAKDECDRNWIKAIWDQVCSGTSASCDGAIVERDEFETPSDGVCTSNQRCNDIEGCVDDETCCECSTGKCCIDNCRFAPATKNCAVVDNIAGCPWGNEIGSNVGKRVVYQRCSGDSTECDGEYFIDEWYVMWCYSNEYCDHGFCTPDYCEKPWDCPWEHLYYCRENSCVYSEDMCDDPWPGFGECDQPNSWCNTHFWVCWPLDQPCEYDEDCTDHPNGEACHPSTKQCYDSEAE